MKIFKEINFFVLTVYWAMLK